MMMMNVKVNKKISEVANEDGDVMVRYELEVDGKLSLLDVDEHDCWVQCNEAVAPYFLRESMESGNPNLVDDEVLNIGHEEKSYVWRFTDDYPGLSYYFEPAFDDAVNAALFFFNFPEDKDFNGIPNPGRRK